jgi:hypothetical protein
MCYNCFSCQLLYSSVVQSKVIWNILLFQNDTVSAANRISIALVSGPAYIVSL